MSRIRVVFVDDQALVRAGLEALLKSLPGIELIRCTGDAQILLVLWHAAELLDQ